jgi:hypothetical protein
MSKWPMRGHFGHLNFETFPMTLRTPQGEVFWAFLSSFEHSGVPEDSNSRLFQVLGFTRTLGQSRGATHIDNKHFGQFKVQRNDIKQSCQQMVLKSIMRLVHSIPKDHVANWICHHMQPCNNYGQRNLTACWATTTNNQRDSTTSYYNLHWETSCCKVHWDERSKMQCAPGNFPLQSALEWKTQEREHNLNPKVAAPNVV